MFLAFGFIVMITRPASAKVDPDIRMQNWTTCGEFINNTVFDPDKIIDINWKIFYFWNPDEEESYNIRFSRPTESLIDKFRVALDEELKPPVNWTNAELFMETTIDFSALLIKTNYSGAYRLIPSLAFEYKLVPTMTFAMKWVEPGYLGIENCAYRICYALAPEDKMPYHYELEKAASTLAFRSDYHRSHIAFRIPDMTGPPYAPQNYSYSELDLEDDDILESESFI